MNVKISHRKRTHYSTCRNKQVGLSCIIFSYMEYLLQFLYLSRLSRKSEKSNNKIQEGGARYPDTRSEYMPLNPPRAFQLLINFITCLKNRRFQRRNMTLRKGTVVPSLFHEASSRIKQASGFTAGTLTLSIIDFLFLSSYHHRYASGSHNPNNYYANTHHGTTIF